MARMPGFPPGGSGSIPGMGKFFFAIHSDALFFMYTVCIPLIYIQLKFIRIVLKMIK